MRHLRASLATTAVLLALPCCVGLAGHEITPIDAPAAAPTTSTWSITGMEGRAEGVELPIGVALPGDSVLVGAPRISQRLGDRHEWRATVSLPGADPSVALESLARALTSCGWDVIRGRSDVFAVRQSQGRWELIQALLAKEASPRPSGSVLDIGIGSRPV
jgi:hypothetical protein